jgi:hypothetical protein
MSFTGTTVRFPAILPLPTPPSSTVNPATGQLVPTVLRGQALKAAAGLAVPVALPADRVIGVALSDSDTSNNVVPVYMGAATLELNVTVGETINQFDLLYSTGDGTFTNVQPTGTPPALAMAVNPNFGQSTVQAVWLLG